MGGNCTVGLGWDLCISLSSCRVTDEANPIGGYEREQRDRGRVAKEAEMLRGACLAAIEKLDRLNSRLLHLIPCRPTPHALIEHVLRAALLLCLSGFV